MVNVERRTPTVKLYIQWNVESSLWDYSDTYIFGKETITITVGWDAAATQAAKRNKQVIFKSCDPSTDYISK